MSDITDTGIEAGLSHALAQIEATRGLYDVLCALKRNDTGSAGYSYNENEKKELALLHKRHLIRRARELAVVAGIAL